MLVFNYLLYFSPYFIWDSLKKSILSKISDEQCSGRKGKVIGILHLNRCVFENIWNEYSNVWSGKIGNSA